MDKRTNQAAPCVLTRRSVRAVSADGMVLIATEGVQAEHILDVHFDERLVMRLVCTATCLEELVVGRLFSEGLVTDATDIASVRFDASLSRAYVTLSRPSACLDEAPVEVVPSATAGSRVFAAPSGDREPLGKVRPIPWSPTDIFELARTFAADSPMHRSTSGVHSCYLARGSEVLCRCEDIGRHNAFDKVVGYGQLNGVDLRECTVFSSGRLPVDMVSKAVRARIPVVASKSVTTNLAIQLAQECNLTLICSAWPDSMRVYNDPMRCAQEAGRAAASGEDKPCRAM